MRVEQVILIGSTLLGSWLGMQDVHESGHVLGAWVSGGRVAKVVINPLAISRTDLALNPHPLFVVWAGPMIGILAPLLIWGILRLAKRPTAFLARFFAGFCLVANGAYIAFGSFSRVGDAGEMLRHGCPPWLLWLFGAATIPMGFGLWHGEGEHFGWATAQGLVRRDAVYMSLGCCLSLVTLGFVIGGN